MCLSRGKSFMPHSVVREVLFHVINYVGETCNVVAEGASELPGLVEFSEFIVQIRCAFEGEHRAFPARYNEGVELVPADA